MAFLLGNLVRKGGLEPRFSRKTHVFSGLAWRIDSFLALGCGIFARSVQESSRMHGQPA
jgi:hypothetical protein